MRGGAGVFYGVKFWREFFLGGCLRGGGFGDVWLWGFVGFCVMLGAGMGSFICCQVRRMREKALGREVKDARSVCLTCKNRILWYDNIPIFSWLVLKGRCRKCGAKIGGMEILAEVILAAVFGFLGRFMYGRGVAWMMFGGILMMLMVVILGLVLYDLAWKEVPNVFLVMLNVLAGVFMVGRFLVVGLRLFGGSGVGGVGGVWGSAGGIGGIGGGIGVGVGGDATGGSVWWFLVAQGAAIGVLAGVYYILYKISQEKWVGSGDYLVGLGLAMVLGSPVLAFLVVFLGNLVGSVYGVLVMRKGGRSIPMVPFLAVGFLGSLILAGFVL